MTDRTHTPGPWHRNVKPAAKYPVIFAGRNTHVARIYSEGLTDAEVEANCDLITAAPELLAALKDLLRWSIDAGFGQAPRSRYRIVANAARAAIARTEEKQP